MGCGVLETLVKQYRFNRILLWVYYLLWLSNLAWIWYKPSPLTVSIIVITFIGYFIDSGSFFHELSFDDGFVLIALSMFIGVFVYFS